MHSGPVASLYPKASWGKQKRVSNHPWPIQGAEVKEISYIVVFAFFPVVSY